MNDALLFVDVFDHFDHEDGDVLAGSFQQRLPALLHLLDDARQRGIPVIYANDRHGRWHGNLNLFLSELGVEASALAPTNQDAFLFKDNYSAFDHTALELLLRDRAIDRLILAGMTLEGCVTQTAIDAREHGLKVTVVAPACARIDEDAAEAAVEYLQRVVGARVVSDLPLTVDSQQPRSAPPS
jgi:nicotinamidase-related amidase